MNSRIIWRCEDCNQTGSVASGANTSIWEVWCQILADHGLVSPVSGDKHRVWLQVDDEGSNAPGTAAGGQ